MLFKYSLVELTGNLREIFSIYKNVFKGSILDILGLGVLLLYRKKISHFGAKKQSAEH